VRRRRGLIFGVLVLVVLIVTFFFQHHFVPSESSAAAKGNSVFPTAVAVAATAEKYPEQSPDKILQKKLAEQKDFQQKIDECFDNPQLTASDTPEIFLKNLIVENPVKDSQFEMENTHVQLPDGSLRRIHLIPSDSSNSKNAIELRYFKLDGEGLPERISLSRKQTINPSKEFIQSLKSQGKIVFHQVKQHQLLKDGTQISLNEVDNKIFEIQIFSSGKTFSCRAMKCDCR